MCLRFGIGLGITLTVIAATVMAAAAPAPATWFQFHSATKSYSFAIQFSTLYWFYMLIICALCFRQRICVCLFAHHPLFRGIRASDATPKGPLRSKVCVWSGFVSHSHCSIRLFSSILLFVSAHSVRWWYSFLLFSMEIYTKTINTEGQYTWMRKSLFVFFVCKINKIGECRRRIDAEWKKPFLLNFPPESRCRAVVAGVFPLKNSVVAVRTWCLRSVEWTIIVTYRSFMVHITRVLQTLLTNKLSTGINLDFCDYYIIG